MKASANIHMNDWQDDESLIKMDSHAWAPPNEGDSDESSNCAVVGFSYQSFLEENLFVSLARPSDIAEIEREASLGKKFHAMSILQFAECHLEILQVLLADGIVTSEPSCGFTLPHVALLHIGAGNPDLSGAICMHLVRQGNARQVFRESAKTFLDNEEIGQVYLEQLEPVLQVAEHVVQYQKLCKELGRKPTSKLIKI